MELVDGKTLRELMGRRLSTKKLPALATRIAEGLAKAHGARIVHRNLKPENIMVREDGLAKILDFGLANPAPASGDLDSQMVTMTKPTRAGVILGTVPYVSAEQAAGRAIDFRSREFSSAQRTSIQSILTPRSRISVASGIQLLGLQVWVSRRRIAKVSSRFAVHSGGSSTRCVSKPRAG